MEHHKVFCQIIMELFCHLPKTQISHLLKDLSDVMRSREHLVHRESSVFVNQDGHLTLQTSCPNCMVHSFLSWLAAWSEYKCNHLCWRHLYRERALDNHEGCNLFQNQACNLGSGCKWVKPVVGFTPICLTPGPHSL